MNPLSGIWNGLLDLLTSGLAGLHDVFEPLFGVHAWGWAIIALTLVIRVLLLPLAIKQTRSMRAMQTLQPRVKAIQAKYKADRDLMKKDPAKYRERKQKANEEVMALYREEGVNPAAGCLPLLLQAPIFFALFRVLQDSGRELANAPFYVFHGCFTPQGRAELCGLSLPVNQAEVWGWVLVVLMAGTMFFSQRQMLNRSQVEGPQAQQQKILMYVMPVFLAFIAQGLSVGVLLYWVTTNLWQVAQQAVIIREVQHEQDAAPAPRGGNGQRGRGEAASGRSRGRQGGRGGAQREARERGGRGARADRSSARASQGDTGRRRAPSGDGDGRAGKGSSGSAPKREGRSDHLPRRPSGQRRER